MQRDKLQFTLTQLAKGWNHHSNSELFYRRCDLMLQFLTNKNVVTDRERVETILKRNFSNELQRQMDKQLA